jgi:hypothetical protein
MQAYGQASSSRRFFSVWPKNELSRLSDCRADVLMALAL